VHPIYTLEATNGIPVSELKEELEMFINVNYTSLKWQACISLVMLGVHLMRMAGWHQGNRPLTVFLRWPPCFVKTHQRLFQRECYHSPCL